MAPEYIAAHRPANGPTRILGHHQAAQGLGAGALRNLCAAPGVAAAAARVGALESCLCAMRQHCASAEVAEACCGALWAVSTWPASADAAAREGAAPLLVAALVTHGMRSSARGEACAELAIGALRSVAAASPEGRLRALDAGALDAARAAAREWVGCGAAEAALGLARELEAAPEGFPELRPEEAPAGWGDEEELVEVARAAAKTVLRQCSLFF
jgi:hypothetical protein